MSVGRNLLRQQQACNALVPRLRYRIYFLPKTKRLVSIEPLP
jgi:hypothetical protein